MLEKETGFAVKSTLSPVTGLDMYHMADLVSSAVGKVYVSDDTASVKFSFFIWPNGNAGHPPIPNEYELIVKKWLANLAAAASTEN